LPPDGISRKLSRSCPIRHFRVYAWVCLRADRHTGQLQSTVAELASVLKRPEEWVEAAVSELVERRVCVWRACEVLEVADRYWPYQRESRSAESKDYVDEVRRMLLASAGSVRDFV
jgi:hypothetical protein